MAFVPRNTQRAKALRAKPTAAEDLLWRCLRQRRCAGAKFTRQLQVGPYYVDFVSRQHKLVVELDGQSHDVNVEHDEHRTAYLEQQGYRLLRFRNADVLDNLDGVVRAIEVAFA